MPRPRHRGPGRPQWLEYMLYSDAFRLGELQAGYTYERSQKDSHGRTYTEMVRVPGTRIPASVLGKFRDGLWTPKQRTLDKMYDMYRRWAYHELRKSGMSTTEAKVQIPREDPSLVHKTTDYILKVARTIARNKGVPLKAVQAALQKSKIQKNRWDSYFKQRKYALDLTMAEAGPARMVRKAGFDVDRMDPDKGVYVLPWNVGNIDKARRLYGRRNIVTLRKPVHEMRTYRDTRGRTRTKEVVTNPGMILIKKDTSWQV